MTALTCCFMVSWLLRMILSLHAWPVVVGLSSAGHQLWSQAFNSLEWPYLFEVLVRHSQGHYFLRLVEILFTNLMARAKISRLISNPIPVHRGTCLGCPLSPLLFFLAMEPLVQLLRELGHQWGIPLGDGLHLVYCTQVTCFYTSVTSVVSQSPKCMHWTGLHWSLA